MVGYLSEPCPPSLCPVLRPPCLLHTSLCTYGTVYKKEEWEEGVCQHSETLGHCPVRSGMKQATDLSSQSCTQAKLGAQRGFRAQQPQGLVVSWAQAPPPPQFSVEPPVLSLPLGGSVPCGLESPRWLASWRRADSLRAGLLREAQCPVWPQAASFQSVFSGEDQGML